MLDDTKVRYERAGSFLYPLTDRVGLNQLIYKRLSCSCVSDQ